MGMFDQQVPRTKLVIVHSENTAVFANYLQMLISSNDDQDGTVVGIEDGTVETVIWSEKEYRDQKPTLSSLDHILFIGGGKKLSEESYGMKDKFDKFGMKYGWLGKRAYLKVSGGALKKDELSGFFDFAQLYDPELDRKEVLGTDSIASMTDNKGAIGLLKKGAKLAVAGPTLGAFLIINDKTKRRIRSCQYRTATLTFYRDGLAEFLKS